MKKFFFSALPILLLTLFLLVYFWPALFNHGTFIAAGMQASDLMLFNYPLKDWYRQMLLSGQWPFWVKNVGNGFPIMAEGQLGVFYPPHLLLFYFLPTLLAFNLNLFGHFLLAGLTTWLLARRTFKLSSISSALAALVYTLSGFYIVHIQQTNILLVISFLPLNLFLVQNLVSQTKLKWVLSLALVFAMQILAGHIEMFYYCVLISFVFALGWQLVYRTGSWFKNWFLFGMAVILAVAISAVQLLSSWELLRYSNRAGGVSFEVSASSAWPIKTLSLFINPRAYDLYQPDLPIAPGQPPLVNVFNIYGYIGLLPLLLVGLALTQIRRSPKVLILAVMLLGSYLWAIGKDTQIFALFWQTIPGLKFFRYPIKILFLIELLLAILAGLGLDGLKGKSGRWGRFGGWVGVGVILIVFADLYFNNLRQQPMIDGQKWFSPPEIVADLKTNNQKGERFYSIASLDYKVITDRKLQKEFQNLLFPNFNLLFNLPTSRALFATNLQSWQNLSESQIPGIRENQLFLPEKLKQVFNLEGVAYFIAALPLNDPDWQLVKSIKLSKTINYYYYKRSSSNQLSAQTLPIDTIYLYQNQKPVFRYGLVYQAQMAKGSVIDLVTNPDFDPGKQVVLEEEPPLRPAGQDFAGQALIANSQLSIVNSRAEMTRYEDVEVEIKTSSDEPGFLVLADTYYPGWHAYVEGKEVKIYRANYGFRAVEVPSGEHKVEWRYEPTYFRLGLLISVVTLVLVLMGWLFTLIKNK